MKSVYEVGTKRSRGLLAGCGAVALAMGMVIISPVRGSAATMTLVDEPFNTGTTLSANWELPSGMWGNSACLTAGTDPTTTPIPGCAEGTPDASGSGVLQLTDNLAREDGGVIYSLSQPTTDGLDATFNTYQYGGNGADGIAFVMAAADPSDPQPPAAMGIPGGDLGYSSTDTTLMPGLSNAYLGIGFDVFGNFAEDAFEGTDCTDPSWDTPYTHDGSGVSVRGPGNGTTGYCALNSTYETEDGIILDGGPDGTRGTSQVPVEVVINPTSNTITTASGLVVGSSSYMVSFTPIGSGTPQTLSGDLPSTLNGEIPDGLYPDSWINPVTGIPYQLTFGWLGSTGGLWDYHEIDTTGINTVDGTPPQLSVSLNDGTNGQVPFDGSTLNNITVTNQSGTVEDAPVDVTDNFANQEAPESAGLGGPGWDCSLAGQTMNCSNPGPIPAGASLPTIQVAAAVTAPAGDVVGSVVVGSSADASPATTNDTLDVVQADAGITASASPTDATEGTTVQLDTTLPSDATGTVSYDLGGEVVCGPVTVSDGGAPCQTSATLPAGDYGGPMADYSGDTNYLPGNASAGFAILGPSESSGLAISANPSAIPYGATTILTATGLDSGATGSVDFTAGSAELCTATIHEGGGQCTASGVAQGNYTVVGTYSGDGSIATESLVVTADPVYDMGFHGVPSTVTAGSSFNLQLALSLGTSGGPAYADPVVALTLGSGETFVGTPAATGWSCTVATNLESANCALGTTTPIPAGTVTDNLSFNIVTNATATGDATVQASLTDAADMVAAITVNSSVAIQAAPPITVPDTGSGTVAEWIPVGLLGGGFLVIAAWVALWPRRKEEGTTEE